MNQRDRDNSQNEKQTIILTKDSETLIDKISSDLKHLDSKSIKEFLINKIPYNLLKERNQSKQNQQTNQSKTQTKQKYIDNIPSEGIILSKPGIYKFKNNITWNPSNNIAIKICSNNVVLDLNDKTLTCNKTEIKTIAIYGENINNVKIINGVLSNFVYKGIDINTYNKIKIKNITVDGLSLEKLGDPSNNTPVGIFLNNGNMLTIKQSIVKNINVRTDSSAAFQVAQSSDIIISDCKVENYKNNDGSVQGFSTILANNTKINNCITKNLQSFFNGNILTPGHTVLGFIPIFCNDIKYYKCQATDLFGCCDDVHGMSIFLNTNVIVKRFYAKNIIDGFITNIGAKATGLEVYGSNIKIYDSYVRDICAINPQDKQSTGFSCAFGSDIVFDNCKTKNISVIDENGNKAQKLGYGTGFGWAPDPRPLFTFPVVNVLYSNCKSKKCQVGFDSWYHINSIWNNLKISDCDISILNEGNSERTYSCGPCSECIIPLETVLKNVATGNKFSSVCIDY